AVLTQEVDALIVRRASDRGVREHVVFCSDSLEGHHSGATAADELVGCIEIQGGNPGPRSGEPYEANAPSWARHQSNRWTRVVAEQSSSVRHDNRTVHCIHAVRQHRVAGAACEAGIDGLRVCHWAW